MRPVRDLSESVLMRMLAAIVMIATGIRLVYWLLAPVLPYLLATLAIAAAVWAVRWNRDHRW